ncbi:MAG TPA: T9SS type A sorting domain-containing protein, partial [Puia sp.]
GLTTVLDNTANNNHATAVGLAMTGSSSNFIVSPLSTILPVVFQSFTAVARDGQGYLQWQTSLEENSKEFIIERSTDGISYSEIGSVAAAGTSHTLRTYSFTDATPATGVNYYRIKEKDLDSKLTYSSIRALHFSATGATRVAWSSAASGQAEITLLPGTNEFYQVIDLNGRKLQQGRLNGGGKLYLSRMAGGIYIVNITTQSGEQINTRILVK